MADVFISYVRENGPFVRDVVDQLKSAGVSVWIDVDDLPASLPWHDEIDNAITESTMMAAFVSPEWEASSPCQYEVHCAESWALPIVYLPTSVSSPKQAVQEIQRSLQSTTRRDRARASVVARAHQWAQESGRSEMLSRGAELREDLQTLRFWPTTQPPDNVKHYVSEARRSHLRRRRKLWWGVALVVFLLVCTNAAFGLIEEVDKRVQETTALFVANARVGVVTREDPVLFVSSVDAKTPDESFAHFALSVDALALHLPTSITWDATDEWREGTDQTAESGDGMVEAVSDDGLRTAFAHADSGLVDVRDPSTNLLVATLVASGPASALDFSPNDAYVAAATTLGVDVLPVNGTRPIELRGAPGAIMEIRWESPGSVSALTAEGAIVTWSPLLEFADVGTGTADRTRLAWFGDDGSAALLDRSGDLSVFDPETASITAVVHLDLSELLDFESDPSGQLVAAAVWRDEPQSNAIIFISDGGRSIVEVPVPGCTPIAVAVPPEANGAYYSCLEFSVGFASADPTGVSLAPVAVDSQPTAMVVVGDEVILGTYAGELFSISRDLKEPTLLGLPRCSGRIFDMAASSSGNQVSLASAATGGAGCNLVLERPDSFTDWHTYPRVFSAVGRDIMAMSVDYSDDGSVVAFGFTDGSVVVLGAETSFIVADLRPTSGSICGVDFLPGGSEALISTCRGAIVVMDAAPYGTSRADVDAAVARKIADYLALFPDTD